MNNNNGHTLRVIQSVINSVLVLFLLTETACKPFDHAFIWLFMSHLTILHCFLKN